MTKKITLSILLTAAVSFYFQPALIKAQERTPNEQTSSTKNLPKFSTDSSLGTFHFDFKGRNVTPNYLVTHFNEWFGADNDHSLKLVNENTDELGIKHSVYQHFYKNTKVQDELVLLHEKNGYLTSVNGEFTGKIDLNPSTLSEREAENIISKDFPKNTQIKFSTLETVVAKVRKGDEVKTYYTSKIGVTAMSPMKAATYYVDNSSRKIVKKLSKIYKSDTPSTSATLNRGSQQITVDSYNGGYRLRDNTRKIQTFNGTNISSANTNADGTLEGYTEYTNSSANYTSDATKPSVEAHWGISKTYDYYLSRHNRNSYDNNGSVIRNYYNVNMNALSGDSGYDGTNAMAIDEDGLVAMVYGNGKYNNTQILNPIVMLDVAGHEFSHLVIGRNSHGGLNYEGESGALNESIADMMGTSIEFYTGLNPNWTLGEGVFVTPPSNAPNYFRNMANPNSAFQPQPDTYMGTYWASTSNPSESNDQGGVHTNSGVGNYWFYLLSQGGSGTNDIGNAYSVSGIGIQKAEKIIYRALMNYFTPNMTYMDAYNATKTAINDLYGANSNEAIQNAKAWYAVGFGNGNLATSETVKASENDFRVYPNPVSQGYFTIETKAKGDSKYELYDLSGKLLIPSQKLNAGVNKVQVNGVQSGVYLLKINSNGETLSKKIIIK
ncbi:M4 family metallopeptidase [Chryseobacterium sp.]|uniref:M4 family metallopeptidase n=1 Tax=Chryseobacterium sp. TaxID=1871047 RepID=UPI0028A2120A|nr:M4 family metallopeptidase [Chryseobacterium sp.]